MSESSNFEAEWDVSPLRSEDPAPLPFAKGGLPQRLGEYEVRGELGRGGMGTVLRGYHPMLGVEVAIKVLRAGPFAPDPRQVERFRREAMASARLRHPNIVGVHTVGIHEGMPYLVMDLVQGESVDDRIKRSGPLEQRLAARITLDLAGALEHAHARQILHRDVKPSNVFLTQDDSPLLGDFGLAKLLDGSRQSLTGSQDVLGTPGFMAPEQARGGLADARSDVYALGATLYAMLTGVPPHQADTLMVFLDLIATQPARPVRQLRSDVHRELAWITMRCLVRDPEGRYPTAGALATDLRRYLDGERVRPKASLLPKLFLGVVLLAVGVAWGHRPLPAGGETPAVSAPEVTAGQQARDAFAAGELERAHVLCGRQLAVTPDDAELRLLRARIRVKQGQLELALADYAQAIELGQPAWKERGLVLRELERPLAAAEDLARATIESPHDAELWRELAWARGLSRDHVGAVEAVERALQLDPDHVDVWTLKAQLAEGHDVDEALRCYDRAIELDRERAQLWVDRSKIRRHKLDWAGAVDDCTEAIRLEPGRSDAWNDRAASYIELGEFQHALDDYDRAIELDPDEPLLLAHRAQAWFRLGEPGRALEDAERALAMQPDHPRALITKANLLGHAGRIDEAIELARRAMPFESVRLESLQLQGELLTIAERWSQAIEIFNSILRRLPNNDNALFMRGLALANSGRHEAAIADLERFLALPKGPGDGRDRRARAALKHLRAARQRR